jgi:hypothetical protein
MEIRTDAWQERYAACRLARAPYSVLCAVLLPAARGRRTIDAEKEMPRLARMTRGRALGHAGPRADETATPWSRCESFPRAMRGGGNRFRAAARSPEPESTPGHGHVLGHRDRLSANAPAPPARAAAPAARPPASHLRGDAKASFTLPRRESRRMTAVGIAAHDGDPDASDRGSVLDIPSVKLVAFLVLGAWLVLQDAGRTGAGLGTRLPGVTRDRSRSTRQGRLPSLPRSRRFVPPDVSVLRWTPKTTYLPTCCRGRMRWVPLFVRAVYLVPQTMHVPTTILLRHPWILHNGVRCSLQRQRMCHQQPRFDTSFMCVCGYLGGDRTCFVQ